MPCDDPLGLCAAREFWPTPLRFHYRPPAPARQHRSGVTNEGTNKASPVRLSVRAIETVQCMELLTQEGGAFGSAGSSGIAKPGLVAPAVGLIHQRRILVGVRRSAAGEDRVTLAIHDHEPVSLRFDTIRNVLIGISHDAWWRRGAGDTSSGAELRSASANM